jgi:hypothetical protein
MPTCCLISALHPTSGAITCEGQNDRPFGTAAAVLCPPTLTAAPGGAARLSACWLLAINAAGRTGR